MSSKNFMQQILFGISHGCIMSKSKKRDLSRYLQFIYFVLFRWKTLPATPNHTVSHHKYNKNATKEFFSKHISTESTHTHDIYATFFFRFVFVVDMPCHISSFTFFYNEINMRKYVSCKKLAKYNHGKGDTLYLLQVCSFVNTCLIVIRTCFITLMTIHVVLWWNRENHVLYNL